MITLTSCYDLTIQTNNLVIIGIEKTDNSNIGRYKIKAKCMIQCTDHKHSECFLYSDKEYHIGDTIHIE